MTLLTKENIEWLFDDAKIWQGQLPEEEADANCEFFNDMKAEFMQVLKRERAGSKRDRLVIKQYLASKGLKELAK